MSEEETVTTAELVDAPDAEVEESTNPETAEADAVSEPAEEPKKPDPHQRKIAEMAYSNRELKRQNAQLTKMMQEMIDLQKQSQAAGPPKIEEFESFDDFLDARDAYKAKQTSPKEASPDMTDFNYAKDELYAEGIARHDDFADVLGAEDVDITPEMAVAIFEIEDPDLKVDTAYYLGNNPKEAAKIAKLSPTRQVAEVAKISAKLEAKQSGNKGTSKAPAPISPVGGKKTTESKLQEGESFEDFLKKRNKQLGRG